MGLRTILLKLHKPSKGKLVILDEAMQNYNDAFQYLLDKAYLELDEIREKFKGPAGYNAIALSKWIGKDLGMELNRYNVEPFKDSLKLDFGMALASYFRFGASKHGAGFPGISRRGNPPQRPEAGNRAENCGRMEKLRPIYFCRYDLKRSYCLLYDREKDRYYAKLYLMNSGHARTVDTHKEKGQKLVYIHKKMGLLEKSRKKEAFIIVPLDFGSWQEKILKNALEKPESLRTAKLLRKNNGYYLAVSIDTGDCEVVETATFMGVSRGLKNKLNYTVVSLSGKTLSSGPVPCRHGRAEGRNIPLNELHGAANAIAEIASRNKSQVIVQNLLEKGDRINWTERDKKEYQPVYRCHDYNQLTKLLDYKLPGKGLPPPVKVSSVDIFYTCYGCGLNSRRNRLTKDIFICTDCGLTLNVDSLGSLNLAKKLINYNSSTIKVKVFNTPEGVLFTNSILGLNCLADYSDNQLEKLKDDIESIVSEVEDSVKTSRGKELAKKISIVKKFRSGKNFMDLIEYI